MRRHRADDQGLWHRSHGERADVALQAAARGRSRARDGRARPEGGGMRDAFFAALGELAREDERVWALTGDLGIGLFDDFERAAPGRYLNVGIAEQNLVGVAAG